MRVYWNALDEAPSLQREVDRILNNFNWSFGYRPERTPDVNLGEDDENVYVELVAPGVDPKSLEVSIEDGVLRIAGTKNGVAEEKAVVRWLHNERQEGQFTHRLRLPAEVNRDKVSAEYTRGILSITLPKAEAAKPKKIKVKVA